MGLTDRVDEIFAPWDRDDSPGCAVAVLHGGEVVHAKGYGMADLEHGVPITRATVFHAASLSKQFTGFATLLLAHGGKLSLDDDVRKHVGEVPDFGKRITLRHLVHHTSGLRDHFKLLMVGGWRPMDEKTEADILELVRRQRALNFRPGEDFNYCNTGYVLLAVAVRRVTGVSFPEFTERHIFKPLGMTATRFRDDHTALVKGRARAYTPGQGGQFGFWVPNFDFVGSTSLNTTGTDLLKWADNLMDARVGGSELINALRTPGKLNDRRSVGYGAGLEIGSYRGLRVLKHSGWDLGYSAHLAVYPSERFGVAILGNLSSLVPEILARRVADVYLAERFAEPFEPLKEVPKDTLKEREGLYRHPRSGRALWVGLAGGKLCVSPERGGESGFTLESLDARRFRGSDYAATIAVVFDGDRMTIGQDHAIGETFRRVRRPWVPTAGELVAYAATYCSRELDATMTFKVENGELVVEQRKWGKHKVSAAYRDAFTDDKATYIFTRRAGAIDGVAVSFERVHRLRFDRIAGRRAISSPLVPPAGGLRGRGRAGSGNR